MVHVAGRCKFTVPFTMTRMPIQQIAGQGLPPVKVDSTDTTTALNLNSAVLSALCALWTAAWMLQTENRWLYWTARITNQKVTLHLLQTSCNCFLLLRAMFSFFEHCISTSHNLPSICSHNCFPLYCFTLCTANYLPSFLDSFASFRCELLSTGFLSPIWLLIQLINAFCSLSILHGWLMTWPFKSKKLVDLRVQSFFIKFC